MYFFFNLEICKTYYKFVLLLVDTCLIQNIGKKIDFLHCAGTDFKRQTLTFVIIFNFSESYLYLSTSVVY